MILKNYIGIALLFLSSATPTFAGCMDDILVSLLGPDKAKVWAKHLPKDLDGELKFIEKADLDQIINEGKVPYEILNKEMAEKYPALEKVLKDPEKFKAEMVARFNAEKIKPSVSKHGKTFPDGYGFDYSDVAGPELKWMDEQVPIKIEQMKKMKSDLQKKVFSKMGFRKKKIAEFDVAIQYLQDIHKEIKSYLPNGGPKVDYASFIELSYYFSRAMGLKDASTFPFHTRMFLKIDEGIDGFKEYSALKEYQLYKDRKFELFPERSTSKGYRMSEKSFEKAFFNPDKFQMTVIPTHLPFDRDIFQRLMPYDIHFLGMTREPILSEGFLRPGGKFYVHDIRHESARVYEMEKFLAENNLTDKQLTAFKSKMDTWQLELNQKIEAIEDHDLKHALIFFLFNNHHDRGFGLLPSMYLTNKPDIVPLALYSMMRVSGQGVDFKNPVKNMLKAYAWLKTFWRPKLPEELAILSAK